MKIRNVLLSSAIAAAVSTPSSATDLTVSAATTSALTTSAASGGSAGNISITPTGSVTISTTTSSTAAITIDSSNSVINQGNISNTSSSSAIGVNLVAGNSGSFTNLGTISIPGSGTPPSATGQFGILLNGNGTFTGDIVAGSASSLSIAGATAQGIAVQAELAGNISLSGNITATGANSSAILTTAPIDGAFINRGIISTVSASTSPGTVNPSPGVTVGFGGNISGGVLNAGPVNASDSTVPAVIKTSGTLPAFEIAPALASDIADISVSIIPDVSNPGFSFINRGLIANDGTQPGVSTLAIQIGNPSGDTSGKTTAFAGAIYNSGTVRASATSDNAQATKAAVAAANANAMLFGIGASIPNLVNTATGTITATTGGPLGGNATALWIQSGASLGTLTNAGTVSANAVATGTAASPLTAFAVLDANGALTRIDNSGLISATTSPSNNAQVTVAVDVSASSLPLIFNNSGVVAGDVRLGNNSASQLTIDGTKASLTGNISTRTSGRVAISVSPSGAGGHFETGAVNRASTFTVGSGGTVTFDIGQNASVVNVSGAASFDANSHIELKTVSLLSGTNIALVHSDTGLAINGNLSTIATDATVQFLYTGSISAGPNDLILTVTRKSASELGLTGAAAIVYEPAVAAAANDAALAAALGALPDAQHVQSALQELQPADPGYLRSAGAFLTDPNSNAIGVRQRRLTFAPQGDGFASWVGGGFDQLSFQGADGHGYGATFGIDFSAAQKSHFGVAFTLNETHLNEDVNNAATKATWYIFTPYLGFEADNFFVNAQLNAGGASVSTNRSVTIGADSRIARADTSETLASIGITGGYAFHYTQWSIAPQLSFSALKMSNGSYTESGASGVDLFVDPEDLTTMHAFAGVIASSQYELFGGHLVPQLLAGWNQSLDTSGAKMTAHFISAPGESFSLTGPQTEHSGFLGGAHVDFGNDYTTISLGYDGTVGSKTNIQSARLRLSSRF